MAFPDIEQTATPWTLYDQPVMRSENITIMSGRVARYRFGRDDEISASRDGVLVQVDRQLSTTQDIQTLHDVVDAAWADAVRISRADRFGGRVTS